MIRVRITRNTVACRRPVMVGEVLDLDDREARLLVNLGKAQVLPTAPGPELKPAVEAGAGTQPGRAGDTPRPNLAPLSTDTAGGIIRRRRKRHDG